LSFEAASFSGAPPRHVAIIMDGNGRWAKKRLLNRVKGHEKGAETVRMVVRATRELGIGHLTLYAFSTENWQRPAAEVSALMTLLKRFLLSERSEMLDNGIRLSAIGDLSRLPAEVMATLDEIRGVTAQNTGMVLHLALSYGGRTEIVDAVRKIGVEIAEGRLAADQVDERLFESYLYSAGIPSPDLLIRTSGEMRLSNFLLWQLAYSELYVTDVLWPDFRRQNLEDAIIAYQGRDRRFGRVDPARAAG